MPWTTSILHIVYTQSACWPALAADGFHTKIVSPLVFTHLPTFFGKTEYRCNCYSCKFSGLLPVKNENM